MNDRLHHLDALRAIAMLLGVFLHAALAYLPVDWPVRDLEGDGAAAAGLGISVALIHGFRMPLFFFLSGYFTAMLRARRGIGGMLRQRAARIAIPLGLATLTIVPLTWAAILLCGIDVRAPRPVEVAASSAPMDIASLAARGDLEGVRVLLAGGADPDAVAPDGAPPALARAAAAGHLGMVELLLERGADVEGLDRDGNSALHFAALFGRSEVVARLLASGADPERRNVRAERPVDFAHAARAPTEFVARLLGIPLGIPPEFAAVEAGRVGVRKLLGGDGPEAVPLREPRLLAALEALQRFPFFHHLWFLWYLCWIIPGYALVAWLQERTPLARWARMRFLEPLRSGPFALLWQVPLVMLAMAPMHASGTAPGFGPETGTGLVPLWSSLAVYAVFFAGGAMSHRSDGSPPSGFGRLATTALLSVAGLVALPALLLGFGDEGVRRLVPDDTTRRWLALFGQAISPGPRASASSVCSRRSSAAKAA